MKRIKRIVKDIQPHWVGNGFPVRSLFSYNEGNDFDPFLLLDYAQPYEFTPTDKTRGVGEHPHRGFETVTVVYQGEIEHRDSSGSYGSIGPGDVQWMTAASGVVHEEFHSEEFTKKGGTFEVAQLWVNLPAKDKMSKPKYQGIRDSEIPKVYLPDNGGSVRVIAGVYKKTQGKAETFTPINMWDIQINAGNQTKLEVPSGHNSFLLVQSGTINVNDASLSSSELALFETEGSEVHVQAQSNARLLFLTGAKINEPVVGQGPFVMNTREEIVQAITDYHSGKMGFLN